MRRLTRKTRDRDRPLEYGERQLQGGKGERDGERETERKRERVREMEKGHRRWKETASMCKTNVMRFRKI